MSPECTFLIDSQPLTATRMLLAEHSPVFQKMLYDEMAEDNIVITDIAAAEFCEMLNFVAGRQIEIASVTQAWSLVYVAHKYFMSELEQICQSYIKRNLDTSNILLSYEYAEMYILEELRLHILKDIEVYIKWVLETGCEDYHMKPSTLLAILNRGSLQIDNSDLVQYIYRWAMVECEMRDISSNSRNISKVLNDSGIKSMLEMANSGTENHKLVHPMAKENYKKNWGAFCQRRLSLNMAGSTKLRDGSSFISNIVADQDVALFGLVVFTEDEPRDERDTKRVSYFGQISITVSQLGSPDNCKVFTHRNNLCYEVDTYVPFQNPFVLESFAQYQIKVKYKHFDTVKNGYRSVRCHYMSKELKDEEHDVNFEFDEICGSVIKEICYYRL